MLEQQNACIEILHLEHCNPCRTERQNLQEQNLSRDRRRDPKSQGEEEEDIRQEQAGRVGCHSRKRSADSADLKAAIAGAGKTHGREHGRRLQKSQEQKGREKRGTEKLLRQGGRSFTGRIADLDKENFRLAAMQEKLEERQRQPGRSICGMNMS